MKIPLIKLSGLGDASATTPTNPAPNWFQRNWEAATGIGIGVIALLILLVMSLRKPRRKSASMGYVRRPASGATKCRPAKRKRAKAPARKRSRKTANTTSGTKRRKASSTTRTKRKPKKRKARV